MTGLAWRTPFGVSSCADPPSGEAPEAAAHQVPLIDVQRLVQALRGGAEPGGRPVGELDVQRYERAAVTGDGVGLGLGKDHIGQFGVGGDLDVHLEQRRPDGALEAEGPRAGEPDTRFRRR